LAATRELQIADIGAGTGISSRLLADRGAHVIAIDPNAAMLKAAWRGSRVYYRAASAEATGLQAHSVDIVTAFQSFHWFVRDAAMREFRRVLKHPGRAAFVWNNRERGDAFNAGYAALVQSFGEEAAVVDRGTHFAPPAETLAAHGFGQIMRRVFPYEQNLDLDGLIGRARSSSYLPREGAPYARLRDGLLALHEQFADSEGHVRFLYRTVVYRGDWL